MSFFPTWRENPLFTFLLFLVLFILFIFLGVKAYLTYLTVTRFDKPTPVEHTIYIEGLGKTTAVPNVAMMTFGISTNDKTVADAQKQNTIKMNTLIDKIKSAGVTEENLQTKDYNAYEKTEWDSKTQKSESVGRIVSQSLEVKIKDTKKISAIVEIAGQNGSTSISGPIFTLDNSQAYETEARTKALAEVKQKLNEIKESLELKTSRVIGYSEWKEEPTPGYGEGKGGAGMTATPPTISTGTQEVKLHVNVTYLLSD